MPKKTVTTKTTESIDGAVEQPVRKKVYILRKKNAILTPPKDISWRGIIVTLERYEGKEELFKEEFKDMLLLERVTPIDYEKLDNFAKRTKIIVLNNSYDGDFSDDIVSSVYIHKAPPMLDTIFQNIKTSLCDYTSTCKTLTMYVNKDNQFVFKQTDVPDGFPKVVLIVRKIRNMLLFIHYNATEISLDITEVRRLYTILTKELVFCQNKYTTFALSQPLGLYESQSLIQE